MTSRQGAVPKFAVQPSASLRGLRFLKRLGAVAVVLAVPCLTRPAAGQALTIPNTFVAGTPAKAADVNANFTAVATAVNGLASSGKAIVAASGGCGASCPSLAANAATTTVISVSSVSITVPAGGSFVVTFNGFAECDQSTGNVVDLGGQILTSSTAAASSVGVGAASARFTWAASAVAYFDFNMNAQAAFTASAGGTFTFYYNANNQGNGGTPAACAFYGGSMTVVYYP